MISATIKICPYIVNDNYDSTPPTSERQYRRCYPKYQFSTAVPPFGTHPFCFRQLCESHDAEATFDKVRLYQSKIY